MKKHPGLDINYLRLMSIANTANSLTLSEETNADLNAIKIYLDLGYTKKEAEEEFKKVFNKSKHKKRYDILKKHITNFENKLNA